MMERDDEQDPAGVRPGAGRLGRRRRVRRRDAVGHVHRRGARRRRSRGPSGGRVRRCPAGSRSALVLEALLRGPDEVLLLDEPDNYLDVPGQTLAGAALSSSSPKTVLFVCHDRELLARVATRIVTLEPGAAGATPVGARGGFATYPRGRGPSATRASRSCAAAGTRSTPSSRPWSLMYRQKAAVQRRAWRRGYRRRETRLREVRGGRAAAGGTARASGYGCGCTGGRTGKRAVVCEALELTGLMRPFDLEVLVRRAGRGARRPTARASRTSCGCWRAAAATPTSSTGPVGRRADAGARTPAWPGWGPGAARVVRADPRAPRAARPDPAGDPAPGRRAPRRDGREQAARALDRYGLARAGEQTFDIAVGRAAGAAADPAARAVRGHPAAARRADRQPRPGLGRGAGGRAGRLRRHRRRRHPRPLVRPGVRPVPDLRRRRPRASRRPSRSGTRAASFEPDSRARQGKITSSQKQQVNNGIPDQPPESVVDREFGARGERIRLP